MRLALLRNTVPARPACIEDLLPPSVRAYRSIRMKDDGDGDQGGGDADGDKGDKGGDAGQSGKDDKGFPASTPVAEMTAEQQAAYWKHQARKHENTAKSRGDYDAVKAKADQYDELANASKTEQERAVEAAKAEARATALREAAPQLVTAKFEALAVGRSVNGKPIDVEALTEDLDLTKYLTDDGKVDVEKVTRKLDAIAPKAENNGGSGNGRRYDTGGGNRGSANAPKGSAGQAEAERRFGKAAAK